MSNPKTQILLTGATGYVGGIVLERFLAHPDAESKLFLTLLVRSPSKAEKLENLLGDRVNIVLGSHNEEDKMRRLAAGADVVIAMADCDDVGAMKAMLLGLKDRFEATGKKPILINTSGAGTLMDDAQGKYTAETIYDDLDPGQIESLPPTQPHRNVDLLVVEADKQGYVNTYIILPPLIYGKVEGRLVELGIRNPRTAGVLLMTQAAIKRGQAIVVGEGKNIWNHVHVQDLADLYIKLYETLFSGDASAPVVGHGREGYFFAENGEYQTYDFAKAIAKAVSAHGIGTEEPVPMDADEAGQLPWKYFGTNCRARGRRARALRWNPVRTTEDFFGFIEEEVGETMKDLGEKCRVVV